MALVDNNEDALTAALLDETPGAETPAPDAAAPDAPQEKTYIVKKGDKLGQLAVQFGVPLKKLAEDNGITDVNQIQTGQEIKYSKVIFDSEATGKTEMNQYDKAGALVSGDYTTGKFTAPGIKVSLEGKGDLSADAPAAVAEEEVGPAISEAAQFEQGGVVNVPGEGKVALEATVAPEAKGVAITGTEQPATAQGEAAPVSIEAEAKPVADVPPTESELVQLIQSIKPTSESAGEVFDGVIENIEGIEHDTTFDAKEFYQQISDDAEIETKKIDDSIAEIAEEKIKPTFSGWNKFMAVLGAAMGAYGSAMTGTPNFALQIMNRAIDADQEQFLASKEIRTKSLLMQRQALLQRKADLLQIGMNEADRMLKVAELQVKKEESVANVESIKQQLQQEQEKTLASLQLSIIQTISEKAAAQKVAAAALSKDQRERMVKAIELKDENGNTVSIPAYLTSTVKEGEKHRESWNQTKSISGILDKIDKVAGTAGAFAPGSLSNTKTSLKNLSSQLIVHLKELYGMGANFTEFEQALVRDQTPTDGLLEQFKVWEQKSKDLRSQLIMKHNARGGSQDTNFAQMPTGPRLGPGMKAGVSN